MYVHSQMSCKIFLFLTSTVLYVENFEQPVKFPWSDCSCQLRTKPYQTKPKSPNAIVLTHNEANSKTFASINVLQQKWQVVDFLKHNMHFAKWFKSLSQNKALLPSLHLLIRPTLGQYCHPHFLGYLYNCAIETSTHVCNGKGWLFHYISINLYIFSYDRFTQDHALYDK